MAIRKYKRKDQNGNICAPMTTAEQVITANENVNLANTLGYLDRADVGSDSFHINKFVANGIIQLYGEHTNTNKGLPIQNASSGHTISGKLFVLDSTINEREVCVTQVLMLSNRVGKDGALYIRTGSATSKASLQDPNSTFWGGWQKQQGLKEMNVVYDVMDIDTYTDNGMYSGIVVNSTNAMVGGLTIETGSTFLIVTLNGYASEKINKYLTPQCTQMLYLVASGLDVNTGETKLKPAQIYTRTGLWTGTIYSWGDWNNITLDISDIEESVEECKKVTNHMVYLGEFDTSKGGEDEAIQYASNRKISLITYDVKDGPTCRIEQTFSNSSATIQYLYFNGRRYVRQISWANNSVGNWVDITGSERIKKLVFNSSSKTLFFEDALDSSVTWGGVQIPIPDIPTIPSAQQAGETATSESQKYVYKGATVAGGKQSTDVVADLNIQTQNNAVQIVSKSWGTNSWNVRATVKPATSSAAGVMSATQCAQLERVASFLAKLETAFGTDDLDTIVNKLASLK